ncbi:MAG: hypothetical protein LBK61_10940 [Spirochaetaceae bacterium]|jgi:hypothetical protein|nr:hypothetical protein [Spirochaetaceae bacterium]
MKLRGTVFRAFLLVAVFVSFAACSGGAFSDPGHKSSGGGNGDNTSKPTKPAKLSSSASYTEAMAKISEIIVYCNAHPGTANDGIKEALQEVPTQSDWNSGKQDIIDAINEKIDELK